MLQYSVSRKRADMYFPKHNLIIEVDEKARNDRDEKEEKEVENLLKGHLGSEIVRINPDVKYFNEYDKIGKISN